MGVGNSQRAFTVPVDHRTQHPTALAFGTAAVSVRCGIVLTKGETQAAACAHVGGGTYSGPRGSLSSTEVSIGTRSGTAAANAHSRTGVPSPLT